jgi:RNA polymerase sigma-54 factor
MARAFGNYVSQETGLGLRIDPRIVLSSHILQITQTELLQAIETELSENPALERILDDNEPLTEEAILRSIAPSELKVGREDYEYQRSQAQDEPTDWTELASSKDTLWDHLQAQLSVTTPPFLAELVDYVVGCVNDRGYLTTPIEEIALQTNRSLEEVELVVAKLKECDPVGVGASDVRECLLLQLKGGSSVEEKLARLILKNHLDDFLNKNSGKLARKFKVDEGVILDVFEVITNLNPFPGEEFASHRVATYDASRAPGVIPDVIISYSEAGWTVDVKGPDPANLILNRSYQRRFMQLKGNNRASVDEKRHVGEYVRRANNFIQGLYQRRLTLRKIGEYLLNHQTGFVQTGDYRFLQPLTRSTLAKAINMHESTVSRATMGKYVQIGNQEIVPFEVFFKPALRVQRMIEEILQTENPANPLSDDAIAKLLEVRGVKVARRTVNKYRDRTRLLSSRKRKSA